MLTNEQKIKAFDLFLKQVEKKIEDEVPDWLNENPYFEVDDEDYNGNRTFRHPPTNTSDARSALCESFVDQGSDIGFGDFFEFIVYALYGETMSKDNPYRELSKSQEKMNTATEVAVSIAKFQQTMLDDIFKSYGFPSIIKTEGGAK